MALVPEDDLPAGLSRIGVAVPADDLPGAPTKKNRSYLGAALESGVRTLGAAGATVLDAINPFTLSEEDAATLYKDDPEGFKRFQEESAAAVLQRFAAEQTKRSREVMQEVSPDETGAVSGKPLGELEYATLDPEKAAYLSPTRVAGDVLQSLPSTLALAVSGYFTRGKALQAYEQALARETAKGVTKAEAQAIARAEAVREGAKSMAVIGGGSEGVVTGAQQFNQALDQVGQLDQAKIEQSPEYQALLDEGYAPETARATLANRVATQSGVTSGVTTGLISAVGGRYLGGLVGEGGSLLPRVGKGFLIEGATEAPQSTLEQINQNVAMQRVDPSQNILEGAGEAAAAGFVVGGVTGGAFGAAFGGGDASRQRQKVAEQALRDAPDAATAAAAANELAGSVADLESAINQYLTPTGAIPTPEQAAATPAPQGTAPREDPTRAMIDRQAGLIAEAQAAPTEFDRQMALDQAQTALPQPEQGRSAGFVDLTPMNDMQAQQRLAVLRDETARAGGNALTLAIVPHPAQADRFAIVEQALPDLSLPQAETNITPDQAQFQIESAALGGQVSQARAEDSATRGPVIDQALKAVEARGGVASPAEARIFQEAGIGQPYDRVDPALGPEPAPLIEPAGAARESFTPNQQIADQEVQADQQARRQSDLAQRDRQLQGQIAAAGQARPAPDAGAVISALVTPGRQRSAEQVRIVNEARNRYSPEDFSILERAATAPFQLNTPERMRLRELRNPPAVPKTSTTVPESGTGLMGTRVAERLGQPSGGRIITTNAKLSTQRVSPGGTVTINDGDTQHEARVVETSRLGTQGRLLQQIARLFNKRLVAFESDTLQADGFVRDGDNESIYINAKSQMSPLAVFGHELTHLLKRDNPEAYAALEAVVQREMRDGSMAQFEQEYGEGANLEEMTSDLVGNRFQEPDFWQSVFDEIAAQNPDNARGIIARLAAAINRAINAFRKLVTQPGFDSDQYVKDISAVKRAVNQALVAYMQQPRLAAEQATEQAVAEVTREIQAAGKPSMAERLREAARAARTEMGETVTASRARATPDSWKATSTDVEMAEEYESRTGMDPYLSEGQLEPRVANAQFSVKRPYAEKDLAKGKENHPILGLPLNKNGTVTLYYPATNAEARRVAQDKRLRGATPQSNRIYLTNESSGPKVMQNRGGMDQDMDGANVLIQVDPSLLHLEREYEDGRKDFFIQLAEGESFARKMKQTKLFTLDAPRTRALSKDTKLTDLERRISSSVEQYLALDSRGRRARLAQAKDVLRREHNVGTLLGENGKLQKTRVGDYGLTYDDKSVASMGLGLASAQKINEQNLSTCPKSAICEGLCLGETSGQNLLYGGEGQFKSGPRLSQYLKTEAMVQHPEDFAIVLHDEIAKFEKWANSEVGVEEIENEAGEKVTQPKQVYQAAIRLNVTSDFRPQTFEAIINAFPNVMFYDYTKLPTRAIADNHHLTYSSTGASQVVDGETIVNSESNWDKMVQRLNDGLNVAMAFTSRTSMPSFVEDEATGQRFQVWDGDNYDARFLDPKREDGVGMIIGLTNKDRTTKPEEAAKKYNGFFLDYDADRDGDTLVIPDQKRLAAGGRKTISIAPARQQVATTDASAADQFVQFSRRRKPAPKKTVKAYKLFRVDARKPGQLFPLFVNANDPVEIGVWLDADEGPLTEKGKVKSKIGDLAYRPGWHAGDVPIATHIGGKSDPSLTAPDVRPDNHVWAEVEMAADRDWQKEADKRGTNAQGRLIAGKAHITDQIPTDGFYRYKTNPNMTGNWLIGGSMKVNRILNDAEVKRINDKAGVADLPREAPFDAKKYGFGKAKLSRQRNFYRELLPEAGYTRITDADSPRIYKDAGGRPYATFEKDGARAAFSSNNILYQNDRGRVDVGYGEENESILRALIVDSDKRQQGRATAVMQDVINAADGSGTVLYLEPTPISGNKMSAKQLADFYKRFGFVQAEEGSDKVLVRQPAASAQLSRQRTGPFYSQLAEAIDQVPARLETQPAQQWKAWLASNASKLGIKKDEIEWSGINDYLDLRGKDKVTKAEIAEYLDDSGVEVGEVLRDDQLGEQLETKFDEFQLPGGENYGELMLNLPDEVMKKLGLADYRVPQLHRYGDRKSDYNRLAHVRFNDRTDADGNRVLFIEEIQSDWAQEGRKKGFTKAGDRAYEVRLTMNGTRVNADGQAVFATREEAQAVADKAAQAPVFMAAEIVETTKPGVSEAPFIKDTKAWVALAVKRMLVFAARNGYDKIAFINGEQSADRYDLSRRIDEVYYRPESQTLIAMRNGTLVINKIVPADELPEFIGKDVAEKLLAAPVTKNLSGSSEQRLSGVELKVGGKGMIKFYDEIVPQVVNDVLKKVGGKMDTVTLVTRYSDLDDDALNDATWAELKQLRDGGIKLTQPGFTITPEMRDKVEGGMPLFSRRRNYGSLNAAQEQALRNVGGIVPDQTLGDRLKELGDKFKKSWFSGIFDQFAPLKDVDQRAYMLARLSKGSDGALEALMLYGKPFMNGDVPDVNVNDEGFIEVMASLKGEHDRFLWWVAAQRAEYLKAQGRENLFTDQDISSLKSLNQGNFEDGTPRAQAYANALAKMNEFNDAVLNIAEQSGLIDGQARQLFKDMPYVPFYRVMEDGVEGPSFSSGLVNQQAWKKLKGGTQKLNEDLLSNVLLNWAHLFDAAGKNRAAVASMQAATQIGIAQQVPAGTKGAVKVMEQGQTKHYTIDDPYIMEAVTALNYQPPGFFSPFSTFKKWLTIGVTASPTFKIKNLMRDSLQAIGTAPMNYNVASNVMKGFKQGSQETQTFASMLAGGGLIRFGSMLDGTNRTNYLIERQGGILLNEGGWKKLQRQMTGLVEAYAELGDRLENVNRVSLYEHLLSKGYSQAEANFMSRDLMDFSLQGRWPVVRFLAQSVPFLNARLQGLSKLGRGAKEDPRRFGYVVGAVALASIALMLAYEDDEDWKKRPDWDRDSNWWFKIGDTAFRIPKPFEIGAIGTVAERTWELAFNDEMSWKRYRARLSHMIFETFAMDPTPQLVVPIAEIYANKDGFTGRPIEGMSLQKLRPEDRATESTSSVARMLGQMGLPNPVALVKGNYEKLSPVQIDHLVRGYFGWIGTTASNILDFGLRPLMDRGERPAYRLKDIFVVGNFAEGLPAGSSRYVDQLYDQARVIEQAYMSYREAVKKGDRERARELLAEEGDKIRAYRAINKISDRVSEINRKIRQIDASRTLSAETKRKMIDQLSQRKDAIAKQSQRFSEID